MLPCEHIGSVSTMNLLTIFIQHFLPSVMLMQVAEYRSLAITPLRDGEFPMMPSTTVLQNYIQVMLLLRNFGKERWKPTRLVKFKFIL